jgi:hypothetical protein
MSEDQKSEQVDDQVEDLDVEKTEAEEVKGGITRKAGGDKQEYMKVTMSDIIISG